jgi:hypothetical protein
MGIHAAREDPTMAGFPRPEVPNTYTTIRSLEVVERGKSHRQEGVRTRAPTRSRSAHAGLQSPFGLPSERPSEPSGIPIVLMLLPVIEVPTSFLYGANWESRAWSIIGKQVATGTPDRPDTPMSEG